MTTFEQFWAIFPNKKAKKAALTAWEKLKDEEKAECVDHLEKRVLDDEDWLKDAGKFIPMPTTFLNQGRWMDTYNSKGRPRFSLGKPEGLDICKGCRSFPNTQRHKDICMEYLPYYDYQIRDGAETHMKVLS